MSSDVGGEWNRDAAYHPWIVRIAAEHAGDVLDVGCGDGLLASRLADVSRSVVGIDRDPVAVAQAAKRLRLVAKTDVAVSEFGTEWGLTPAGYDVITMVSVLHELPLRPALERAAELLKPGGTLIVVGQARVESWPDRLVQWASVPIAWGFELFYAWRGMYRPEFVSAQSVPPRCSFAEVTDAAAELLPGAELHRGLLGRFRLRWSKPVGVAAPEPDLGAMAAASTGAGAVDATDAMARDAAEVPARAASGAGSEEDPHVLAPDAVDELSRLFEQTREVPTIEPGEARRGA